MKVTQGQAAPDFNVKDVYGNPVSLALYRGSKIHLVFYRFAGCPFCNLQFHKTESMKALYKKNNVKLISVYESSAQNLLDMMADEKFYAQLVPNPDSSLYKLYEIDRSMPGLLRYLLFNGGLSNAFKGMKLFKKKVAHDGHTDRLEAEFLIDEKGKVVNAHYGKIPGDYLPKDAVKAFIEA